VFGLLFGLGLGASLIALCFTRCFSGTTWWATSDATRWLPLPVWKSTPWQTGFFMRRVGSCPGRFHRRNRRCRRPDSARLNVGIQHPL